MTHIPLKINLIGIADNVRYIIIDISPIIVELKSKYSIQ